MSYMTRCITMDINMMTLMTSVWNVPEQDMFKHVSIARFLHIMLPACAMKFGYYIQ
jgi:hypothetical protein